MKRKKTMHEENMKIKVTVLYVQEMEIEMTKGRLCTWVGKIYICKERGMGREMFECDGFTAQYIL